MQIIIRDKMSMQEKHREWFKLVGESKGKPQKSMFTQKIPNLPKKEDPKPVLKKEDPKPVMKKEDESFISLNCIDDDPPKEPCKRVLNLDDDDEVKLIKKPKVEQKQEIELEEKNENAGICIGEDPVVDFSFGIKKTIYESIAWTEKYRPKTLDEFVGNKKKVEEIRRWLIDHYDKKDGTKLALMIVGPSGCGKTVAASLIPKCCPVKYIPQEFNMASVVTGKREKVMHKDNPNKESSFLVDGILPAMARNNMGSPHVVILDQAEDLITKVAEFRVLWKLPESIQLRKQKPLHGILQPVRINAKISKTKKNIVDGKVIVEDCYSYEWPAPLILTVNNYQAPSIEELKYATIRGLARSKNTKERYENSVVKTVFFDRLSYSDIATRLRQICIAEKIDNNGGLDIIAKCSMGDMRRAIIMLEAACQILPVLPNGRKILNLNDARETAMMYSFSGKKVISQDPKKAYSLPDEEELREFIPDMTTQEIMMNVLKEDHNREYLEQIFQKYDDSFMDSMLHVHIPKFIATSYGNTQHPYLPPLHNNSDNNNHNNDPSMNVMDGITAICENWSLADIYNGNEKWKMMDFSNFHSRVMPCLLFKHPKRSNKFGISLDWTAVKQERGMKNSHKNAKRKMISLKIAFQTDEEGVMIMAKFFSIITLRWNIVEFVEGITKWLFPRFFLCQDRYQINSDNNNVKDIFDMDGDVLEMAAETSIWEISGAIHRYFSLPVKSESGDLQDIGIDADDEQNMTLDLIEYLATHKTKEEDEEDLGKAKRKKKSDQKTLDLDPEEDLRKRMNVAQDMFAKFLAICRITDQDLTNLAYFSIYNGEDKNTFSKLKEFCPGLKKQPSLNSRLNNLWSRLNSAGIHVSKRQGSLMNNIKLSKVIERELVTGISKKESNRPLKGTFPVSTSMMMNRMNELMFPQKDAFIVHVAK